MSARHTSLEDKQRWMRERHGRGASIPEPDLVSLDFKQRHYTVTEISEMWGLSADATRKLFENEPGVLVLAGGGHKANLIQDFEDTGARGGACLPAAVEQIAGVV